MSETKVIDIKELKFDEHNFNRHNDEGMSLLEKSIKENGLGRSILLDKDNNIVGGNGVTEKAIELGKTKVRIIETDGTELIAVKRTDLTLDSEQGRKMALADNSVAHANLQWNEDELQKAQDEWGLVPEEWGVEMPDFGLPEELAGEDLNPEELEDIQGDDKTEMKEDDFDPDAHYETKVKAGEVWQLGEHRLMCGDSTEIEDVKKLMGEDLADLWLTDPPYNVAYEESVEKLKETLVNNRKVNRIQNDKMSDKDFIEFLRKAFTSAMSVAKAGCPFYIWAADKSFYQFLQAAERADMKMRQMIIWNKSQFTLGMSDYHPKHEPCIYGWKGGAAHNWYADRKQTTVVDWEKPRRSEEHPTMKPVGLFGYLVQCSSKEGDIVLDTFGGSGTTIVACEELKRKARLMEIDPHYCNVILARWEKLTGQKAVKLNL